MMKNLMLILMSMFILTSCSKDDDDENDDAAQYSFGRLTVANFPTGWYGQPNPNSSTGVSRTYGITIGGDEKELYMDVWHGLDHKANPHFNDVSINKNIIIAENNMFILKFRLDEYPDRFEITYVGGEAKPEYEYKFWLHFGVEISKYINNGTPY